MRVACGGEGSVVAWGFLGRGHPSQTRAGGVTWCPTEGLAKCGYKKAFVNVRSPLMGGGSGLCQLLFVQRRKQRGCLRALGLPHVPWKWSHQIRGEQRWGW